MKTINIYEDNKLIGRAGLADNYFLRLRGLIGRNAKDIGGLLIKPCNQIHTCFMKEDIDVVYLSKEGLVVKVDEAVPKSKFFAPVKGAGMVLELPSNTALSMGIEKDKRLSFPDLA